VRAHFVLLSGCLVGDAPGPLPPGGDGGAQAETGVPMDSGGSDGGVGDGGGGGSADGGSDSGVEPEDDFDGDGFVESDGDCDDTDPAVNPLGTEVGGNGKDDDCDGYTDLDDIGWEAADPIWMGTREYDPYAPDDRSYGWLGRNDMAVIPDFDGDGLDDLAATSVGGLLLLGSATGRGYDAPRAVQSDARTLYGEAGDGTLWEVVRVGDLGAIPDLDGDGVAELGIAQQTSDSTDANGIGIYTHATLAGTEDLDGRNPDLSLLLNQRRNSIPDRFSTFDDLDGDGLSDLVVGSYHYDSSWGRIWVLDTLDLEVGDPLWVEDLARTTVRAEGEDASWLGRRLHVLDDLDGDGYPTLAEASHSRVYFIDGDDLPPGEVLVEGAAFAYLTDARQTIHVFSPGDVDGDGRIDVLSYDETNDELIEGVQPNGRVDVYLDLLDGGAVDTLEANAHLAVLSSTGPTSAGTLRANGPAWLARDEPSILVGTGEGVALLRLDELPTKGLLDLAGWEPAVRLDVLSLNSDTDYGPGLLAADLDHDGDDELIGRSDCDLRDDPDAEDACTGGMVGFLWNPG
jgi:hypothetical protein